MGTNVKIYFILKGDFDPSVVTKEISVSPDEVRRKGEQGKYCVNKFDSWLVGTDYIETLFLDEGLNYIVKKLNPHSGKLKRLVSQYGLAGTLEIVVNVKDNQLPGLYIPNHVTVLMGEIGASIDIDMYLINT